MAKIRVHKTLSLKEELNDGWANWVAGEVELMFGDDEVPSSNNGKSTGGSLPSIW
jgi:hypothetical protein